MQTIDVSTNEAVLSCPRSEGTTRAIRPSGFTVTSSELVENLAKVASSTICGRCAYGTLTRVEGEALHAQELTAQAGRIEAETLRLRAQADQDIAKAEIARGLAAAGIGGTAEVVEQPVAGLPPAALPGETAPEQPPA